MYIVKVRRFLNLVRLLDVMSAEPVIQLEYLRWQGHPDPESSMCEFFEDLQGYASLFEDMLEDGDLIAAERELFDRLLRVSDSIDAQADSYTRREILYGDRWSEMRDTALLLKLSLSSRPVLKPGNLM